MAALPPKLEHVAAEAGRQVRAEVEAFAARSCLNESELEELSSLAGQLRDGLQAMKGENNE